MIIKSELRSEIARALRGESSLNDLYRWLMARSWNMHKDSDPSAVELAASVESLFFQRADGEIDDLAIRSELTELLVEVIEEAWEVSDRIGSSGPFRGR